MGIFLDGKHLLFNLHLAQDGFGFLRKSKPFIGIHGISFVWLRPLILSVSVIVWGDIASVYYPCCSLVSFLGFSDPLLPLSVKCVCLIFTLHSTVKSQNVHLWILNMHLLKCDVSLISGMKFIHPCVRKQNGVLSPQHAPWHDGMMEKPLMCWMRDEQQTDRL